jgi:pimeloyl-ACP methyl ester carboxylesterase
MTTTLVEPTSQQVTVNGLRVHYLEWGHAEAPAMVCVHGYTSSAQAFNAPARRFQDRFHIIAPDVRGHGESAWSPTAAYQYDDQVGDLAALVEHLGLDRFVLIGTSMGGIIAMAYAGAHPARLRRLVLNDIGPDIEGGSQRITAMVSSRPEEFATLDDAMAHRRQASPIVANRSVEDQRELALGVLRQRPDGRWAWKMDPAYIEQRVRHGAPRRPALWPALQRVPWPTLVVWGTESDVLSEAQARRMVEVLPHGELVAVPGVGHAPTLVEPVVLAALERFLGEESDRATASPSPQARQRKAGG